MFESLTKNIVKSFDALRGQKLISQKDLDKALQQVKFALLEADVAIEVVKQFLEEVEQKIIGENVIKSVDPVHMTIKIIQDKITDILKSEGSEIDLRQNPAVILMLGLQGAGKTTTSVKLAKLLTDKYKKKALVASLDISRPAAQEQLKRVAQEAEIESLEIISKQKPEKICKRALSVAKKSGFDVVILDSAGRLSIDDALLKELKQINKVVTPVEKILVLDALTGQDALNTVKNFYKEIGLTGIILSKLDGDSRGGVALSMKYATNVPIKFIGVGEKISDFQKFDAERIASRILDMGDIFSLVEKAEDVMGKENIDQFAKKLSKGEFNLNDVLEQLQGMDKMGGMGAIMKLIPGAQKMKELMQKSPLNPEKIAQRKAIILSMTFFEREYPEKLNTSRKRRIAKGSGFDVPQVNQLLKMYKDMKKMMKKGNNFDPKDLQNMNIEDLMRNMK